MGIVTADRTVLYLVEHPYYNQLWGTFAFPFMLLFGFRWLREPRRDTAVLFALFTLVGLMAYPLMLPFPLWIAIAACAAVRRGPRVASRAPAAQRAEGGAADAARADRSCSCSAAGAQKGIDAVERDPPRREPRALGGRLPRPALRLVLRPAGRAGARRRWPSSASWRRPGTGRAASKHPSASGVLVMCGRRCSWAPTS